jgi:hypothetical protein
MFSLQLSKLNNAVTGFSGSSFSMAQPLSYFPFIWSHSFIFNLLSRQATAFGFHGNWIPAAACRHSCSTNLEEEAKNRTA